MAASAANLYTPIDFNLDFPEPDHHDNVDDDKSPAQEIHDSDTGRGGFLVGGAFNALGGTRLLSGNSLHLSYTPRNRSRRSSRISARRYTRTPGTLIRVSVGPMSESDYDEWKSRGRYPTVDTSRTRRLAWGFWRGEGDTIWDVFFDMAIATREQVASVASGISVGCGMAWLLELLEEEWQHTEGKDGGEEVNKQERLMNIERILNAVPPRWMSDSSATFCMLCSAKFHPIMCPWHHYRFYRDCSKGRSLLPPSYRTADPQRMCDSCSMKLEDVLSYLMNEVNRAAQPPTHDLRDLSTLRSWLNLP